MIFNIIFCILSVIYIMVGSDIIKCLLYDFLRIITRLQFVIKLFFGIASVLKQIHSPQLCPSWQKILHNIPVGFFRYFLSLFQPVRTQFAFV